jgi:hypothetical protein
LGDKLTADKFYFIFFHLNAMIKGDLEIIGGPRKS